jgi:hypothetical protein
MLSSQIAGLFSLSALLLTICCAGCSKSSWQPKTTKLDSFASYDTNFSGVDRDVERFYVSLREKQWKSNYEQRWKSFKQVFPEELYLQMGNKDGANWNLQDYEVLAVDGIKDGNMLEARLICKFVESHNTISYSTIRWRKEDGEWRCDEAGPRGLTIFRYILSDK